MDDMNAHARTKIGRPEGVMKGDSHGPLRVTEVQVRDISART